MGVGPKERLLVSRAMLKLDKAFDFLETVQQELKALVADGDEDVPDRAALTATVNSNVSAVRDRDNANSRLPAQSVASLVGSSVPERRDRIGLGDVIRPDQRDEPPDHYLRICMQNDDPTRKKETIEKLSAEEKKDVVGDSYVMEKGLLKMTVPIMHPETPMVLHWMLVGMCFIVYEVFITPYRLCFQVYATPQTLGYYWEFLINCYFILDLIGQFHIGYFDEAGTLIVKQSKIASKYFHSWFLLDLVAAIPFDWLIPIWEEPGSAPLPTKLFRILKVVRFLRLARLLRLAKLRRVFDKVEMELESSMAMLFGFQVFKIIVFLGAVAHLAACFWYYVGSSEEQEKSWITGSNTPMLHDADLEGSWQTSLTNQQKFTMWLWALHYVTATMTTVGYGDVHPTNTAEVIYTLLLLWISIIVFSGCLGILMSLINSIYDSGQKRRQKLVDVAKYLRWRAVPRGLRSNIRQYLCFVWENNEDAEDLENFVMSQLSPTLRAELSFHVFGRVLQAAPFLVWLTDVPVVLKTLSMSTMSRFYEAGDTLFATGEVNSSMFFLISGWVEVIVGSIQKASSEDDLVLQGAFLDAAIADPKAMAANFQVARRRPDGKSHAVPKPALVRAVTKSSFAKSLASPLYAKDKKASGSSEGNSPEPGNKHGGLGSDTEEAPPGSPERSPGDPPGDSPSHPLYVEAPAFFGDSCIWALDQPMPKPSLYTASCYRRSEFATLSLAAIKSLVSNFPFLFDRYQVFRRNVFEKYNGKLPTTAHHGTTHPPPDDDGGGEDGVTPRSCVSPSPSQPRMRQRDLRKEGERQRYGGKHREIRPRPHQRSNYVARTMPMGGPGTTIMVEKDKKNNLSWAKTVDQSERYLPAEELPEPAPEDYPPPLPGSATEARAPRSPESREAWTQRSAEGRDPNFEVNDPGDLQFLQRWGGPLRGVVEPDDPARKMVHV